MEIDDIENLPELTDEQLAALESITPDMVDRIFRGDDTKESECQRVDDLVKATVDGRRPMDYGFSDTKAVSLRYLSLLQTVKDMKPKYLNAMRELIALRKSIEPKRGLSGLGETNP